MSQNPKNPLSRRELFLLGAQGAALTGVGLGLLNKVGQSLPGNGGLGLLKRAISENTAQAATANIDAAVQYTLIDKLTYALIFPETGTIGTGDLPGLDGVVQNGVLTYNGETLTGAALAANAVDWRGLRLTSLFGGPLKDLPDDYNIAFITQCTSNAGGHNLGDTDFKMELGGFNSVISGVAPSLMDYVGFKINADANSSIASAVGPGRVPLPTYDSVGMVRQSLYNSVAALKADQDVFNFRSKLDSLATTNDQVLSALRSIKDRVDPVLPELLTAMTKDDVVKQQTAAVIALAKGGLANNFMVAVPWDDTNGGGSLVTRGGQFNLSPYLGVRAWSCSIVDLAKAMPNSIFITVCDGGRSRNNGDAAGCTLIIGGPKRLINNGIFGKVPSLGSVGNAGATGQEGTDYRMSDGTTRRTLEHRHVMALMVKIVYGLDLKIAYPLGISPLAA